MKLGVESFTIIDDVSKDLEGTLKKLSDLGFRYIEWLNRNSSTVIGAGFGLSPADTLKIFNRYDMKIVGAIASDGPNWKTFYFDTDKVKKVIDWYQQAGCTTFGTAIDFFGDLDFLKRRIEAYNRIGEICKNAGMSFMYHNHSHEWAVMEGKTIFDRIVDETDSELVGFDLDTYWAYRGMQDSAALIRELKSRIKSIHVKDFPLGREEFRDLNGDLSKAVPEDFTECGKGVIQWQEIVNACNEVGVPYMFVEQDHTSLSSKYETLRDSRAYMYKLEGVSAD